MKEFLNIWIINRITGDINYSDCSVYTVSSDYLVSEKSTFTLNKIIPYEKGDFVLAKISSQKKVLFFGTIESYDNSKIVCDELVAMLDFDFPATYIKDDSYENYFKELLIFYLINDFTKLANMIDINVVTHTPHIYNPENSPNIISLRTYAINAFKKYGIVWRFEAFNGRIKTIIGRTNGHIQLKNNVNDFINWEVNISSVADVNKLLILDKGTYDARNPIVLSTYYVTKYNELTQDEFHPDIKYPTKTKITLVDENDSPVYEEIAESELKGNYYSHEINVDIKRGTKLIDLETLTIGSKATIIYDNKVYESVLTGFKLQNNSNYISLNFGHVRSKMSELLF